MLLTSSSCGGGSRYSCISTCKEFLKDSAVIFWNQKYDKNGLILLNIRKNCPLYSRHFLFEICKSYVFSLQMKKSKNISYRKNCILKCLSFLKALQEKQTTTTLALAKATHVPETCTEKCGYHKKCSLYNRKKRKKKKITRYNYIECKLKLISDRTQPIF